MLKCIAIDDEPLALRQIKTYIERISIWNSSQHAVMPIQQRR